MKAHTHYLQQSAANCSPRPVTAPTGRCGSGERLRFDASLPLYQGCGPAWRRLMDDAATKEWFGRFEALSEAAAGYHYSEDPADAARAVKVVLPLFPKLYGYVYECEY